MIAAEMSTTSTSLPSRMAWMREPLLVVVASRIALLVVSFAGQILIPRMSGPGHWSFFAGDYLLDGWARWDSAYYVSIAQNGYFLNTQTHFGSVAFFPLYPIAIALVEHVIPGYALAGLVVSHLSFTVAVIVLYRLTQLRLGQEVARRTVLFLAVFPYALYYSAVYTESLFLLLAVLSFWFAERRQWWGSGITGLLCALTRSVGATLCPALLLLYLGQCGYRWQKIRADILSLALIPSGTLLYMSYLFVRFRHPLAFAEGTLVGWKHYNPFVEGFSRLNPASFHPGDYNLVLALNLVTAIAWLLATVPTWRLLGPAYAAFVALATLMSLPAGTDSVGRYMSVLFPVFIVAGYYLRGRVISTLTLASFAAILAVFTALFANWYWIV